MSFKVEELGKSMVKLTIEVAAEEFEKAMETAYRRIKINCPYRVFVRVRLRVPWLKRCMARAFSTRMRQMS